MQKINLSKSVTSAYLIKQAVEKVQKVEKGAGRFMKEPLYLFKRLNTV